MPGRILIVDDEANIRNALAKLMTKFGHSVKAAASVVEALALLRSGRFDVVVTDLKMPAEVMAPDEQCHATKPSADLLWRITCG